MTTMHSMAPPCAQREALTRASKGLLDDDEGGMAKALILGEI